MFGVFLVPKSVLLVCVIKKWLEAAKLIDAKGKNRKINLKSSTIRYNYNKLSGLQGHEFLLSISEINQDCCLMRDYSLPEISFYLLLQSVNSTKF